MRNMQTRFFTESSVLVRLLHADSPRVDGQEKLDWPEAVSKKFLDGFVAS